MKRHTATLACAALFLSSSFFAHAQKPCFAFLLKGDITVTCGDRRTQITRQGDLDGFAVSDQRTAFVYTRSQIIRNKQAVTTSVDMTTIVDLKSGASKTTAGESGIVSTCGGIFSANMRGSHPLIRDSMTGEHLSFPPYKWFRCSADRKIVTGTVDSPGGELFEGTPPNTKIASAGAIDAYGFNISPDGSKIAYHNGRLCLSSGPGLSKCAEWTRGALFDTPSVNNSGELLVAVSTGEECFYRSTYNFSPKQHPGARADECVGIGYWNPSTDSIQVIEPIGRAPQWISPATSELLRKWAARQTKGSAIRR